MFPSPIGVIFSLISLEKNLKDYKRYTSFRLLSELYSLLLYLISLCIALFLIISFRLLSELYSLLSYTQKNFCLQQFIELLSCDFLNFKNLHFILSKIILNLLFLTYRLLFIKKNSTSHFHFLIFLHKFELLHFDLIYKLLLNLQVLHTYQFFQ